jgi:uncharacterized membrane protein
MMPEKTHDPSLDPIAQNTEIMLEFHQHEKEKVSGHQRLLERVSMAIGSPGFLCATLLFVVIWICANLYARQLHIQRFDPPPFSVLQGIIALFALITTIVVLIQQNHMEKMDRRRAHLELQVNLLTEQKVTKLINLIEELRHDLPMIKDRVDHQAEAFQVPTDPKSVLKALDDRVEPPA